MQAGLEGAEEQTNNKGGRMPGGEGLLPASGLPVKIQQKAMCETPAFPRGPALLQLSRTPTFPLSHGLAAPCHVASNPLLCFAPAAQPSDHPGL